ALVIAPVIVLAGRAGDGAPEVVDLLLQVLFTLLLAAAFFLGGDGVGALIAIHAVVHQGMAGVEQVFHGIDAVALLALGDVLPGKDQVVDDRAGVGPGAEQVVTLEKAVVAVAGVGDDQGLHGDGVLFHQVGDAGVGIDHDLVGQTHLATAVGLFRAEKMLAVGPVVITQRHAHRGVGVHHLLGGDHLDLVGVGVERIAFGDPPDFAVVGTDQLEGPFRTGGDGLSFHTA